MRRSARRPPRLDEAERAGTYWVDETTWDRVIAAEPSPRPPLTEAEFDAVLEVIADIADLKSPWFSGHSHGVADLAARAVKAAGMPEGDVCHALLEDRPHRPALEAKDAAARLRAETRDGRLNTAAVDVALGVSGHRRRRPGCPPRGRGAGPGGMLATLEPVQP